MNKTALVTGITGQDGACLAEFLLRKGCVVHGLKRRSSSFNTSRVDHLYRDPHEKARFETRLGLCQGLRGGHVADASAGRSDDYVVAAGETHSVREFVEKAFLEIGATIAWRGEGIEETGVIAESDPSKLEKSDARLETGQTAVRIDPRYFRPTEVDFLLGDPAKAAKHLGWRSKTGFGELVKTMVAEDIREAKKDKLCQSAGFDAPNHFE